jgi:Fe-S cluster biogenesis protein NfuA
VADTDRAKADAGSTIRQSVQAVIEAHVLPYVRNHGGDVRIVSIDADGTVTCQLDGACRGCPAAPVTVVAVIERALQTHVGPALTVKAPQLSVSSHAVERIRRLFPASRRGTPTSGKPAVQPTPYPELPE